MLRAKKLQLAMLLLHPGAIDFLSNAMDAVRWEKQTRKLGYCGDDTQVDHGFTVFHPECIRIGDGFRASRNMLLQSWPSYNGRPTNLSASGQPQLLIGNNVQFAQDCQISCANEIVIGDGCLFGGGVFITDNLHGSNLPEELDVPPAKRSLSSKGGVYIGKNVWLGRNVCVMPGVTIGDGAIIGANAVVTHDVAAHAIAVGIPAREIRLIQ